MTHATSVRIIPLGVHTESVMQAAIRGDTISALQAVVRKGKSRMNSAHLLHVFSKFQDEDWDRALVIWWQALMVFCFFGGAMSAAVWA